MCTLASKSWKFRKGAGEKECGDFRCITDTNCEPGPTLSARRSCQKQHNNVFELLILFLSPLMRDDFVLHNKTVTLGLMGPPIPAITETGYVFKNLSENYLFAKILVIWN